MEDTPIQLPNTRLVGDNVYSSSSNLSNLEAEVLGEYARLAKNLDQVNRFNAQLTEQEISIHATSAEN